ncbi:alpha/beta-hydrolase [Testicularia cyperi]|uniref:Alpha/beta-hydrolase n=1 Tax=Testicularia cyperi TaxID=1882483 RepID=A0A317XX82_9BASI|nr:alpha/beta-hydrolase [Testicularia cyperi]
MSWIEKLRLDKLRIGHAGTASLLFLYGLLSTTSLRTNTPKVLKSPPKTSDPPYPHDILPNGKDLETPYGRIRYYEFGPEEGKKLLLVHGISTPAPVWSLISNQLVKAGYRLLVFDLYGRGYSDTPLVKHDAALFVSQIALLLAHLPHWHTFDLAGMSLGGGIVSQFAYYFPDRIDRLLLLCPAGGTPNSQLGLVRKIIRSNIVPNWLVRQLLPYVPLLPTPPKGSLGWWQKTHHPGYTYSFTSSLQDGPIFDSHHVHRHVVASFGNRVRAIWGDKDDVVPIDTAKYFGDLDVSVIPGAGHFAILTHSDQVVGHMLDFLGSPAK